MRHQPNITKNRPVIGLTCSYIPEEIIVSAGLTPCRIYGDVVPPELAVSYLPSNFCPYVLSCLDCGLKGDYNFLDGIIIANSCNAMRRLYDVWRYFLKTPFVYMLDIPKSKEPSADKYFEQCLTRLISALEKQFSVKITGKSLIKAIRFCNETRFLLNQLYNFKKEKNCNISNQEIYELFRQSKTLPKEEFNTRLYNRLAILRNEIKSIWNEQQGIKLLITGSFHIPLDLIDYIETLGARVVYEDICTSCNRYVQEYIGLTGNPLQNIAHSYLHKPPCARMVNAKERLCYLLKLVNQYNIDGIVYYALKFCDTHLLDFPFLKKELGKIDLPILFLEGDTIRPNSGQIKTRIKAFLEVFTCKQLEYNKERI